MSTLSPLGSDGIPYVFDSFLLAGVADAAEFDEAEAEGTPLEVTPADSVERVTEAMPLDQLVVSFD
jgi:hypothetical protein